jgi:glycerophosphoryl diester phosphodiesterase
VFRRRSPARHGPGPTIGGTTDVADHKEFADRRKTKVLDGVSTTGWFTEDFTLAELKTLRAIERIPANRPHSTLYNGRWDIPTFEEVLTWQDEQTRRRGKQVWIYPETKHPTYFRKLGLGLEERVAKLLHQHGKDKRNSPVILQSFEPTSIQRLNKLVDNPLVVLLSAANTRPGTSSRRATRARSPTWSPPRASGRSRATPRASARPSTWSSRRRPTAVSTRRPPWSPTRTGSG